jgi:DNA-binding NarL/FixJ family response regulator
MQQRGLTPHVIMLTAFGLDRLPVAALQAGALDYFRKDEVTSSLLGKAVQQAIETARLQTQVAGDAARLRALEAADVPHVRLTPALRHGHLASGRAAGGVVCTGESLWPHGAVRGQRPR